MLLLWKEEAVGERVELIAAVVAPLLEVVQVVDHVRVRSLPSGCARVVVHVVHAPTRVNTPLPPVPIYHANDSMFECIRHNIYNLA